MTDHLGYTTQTRNIDVSVFITFIQGDIKNLIRKYGHKNCGLKHEELCKEIKNFITEKKKLILSLQNQDGKDKWNREWSSQKKGFFNKLFQEEGFTYMCDSRNKNNNPSINQLLSKYIDFCKEKDERLSALGKNPEYNDCREYNMWIDKQRTEFTNEYLNNAREFRALTVNKYFSTKENPQGHDPRRTYHKSKLDCTQYNPPPRSDPNIAAAKAPTISLHSPAPPDLDQKSQGNGRRSIPGEDGRTEKEKSDIKIPPKTEPAASDSLISPPSKTKVHDTPNGKRTDLEAKGTGSPVNAQSPTGQATEANDARTPSPEQLPVSPRSISPKDSSPATVPNSPYVIKVQDADPDATTSTISATSDTTHSIKNVQSPLGADLSLVQSHPQPLPVAPGTANNSKEPTLPDPVIKSTDQGASLIFALDPGLASSKAEASSGSGTSPTLVSTTTDSVAGSSPTQDTLLITLPPQSTTTTSIVSPPALTQTTLAMSDTSTTIVSAMGTQPVSSITGNAITTKENENPKAPLKTKSYSEDSSPVFPKKPDDSTVPSIGAQSPDPSANLNINISPGQTLRTLPSPLGPLPDSSADSPPGLSSGISPGKSPAGFPDVSTAVHGVVNKPAKPTADNLKITTSPKYAPPHYIGTTLISNTPSPKVTYPSEKPSIEPTEFPPLINIIPTTLILLATLTILFLLYKYTPFGLFLGRRRRKKKDLRTVFEIPEESTYESPNETIHEWDDHLGRQIMENDVYVKLQKINRYKKEMQKKKKKRDTTLIEVHMEILEECKNDEWELHKGDFLEICLQEFINEKNRTAENWPNAELTVNNVKNDKIIQDAEENEILWNFWMGNYRNILESWKSEEWFQSLKNEWKKERQKNHNKIDKFEENTLKESEMISIECEKDIWKKWISKQATLIEMFKQEDWFKSLIAEQDKEEDNYEIKEYINVLNTNMNEVEKEKKYHEFFRKKNIINKLMVQIHMMVLEECKKEEIVENKELCIDNYIQSIHKKNNYDEKSNIL